MTAPVLSAEMRKRLKSRFWRLNNLYWIEDKKGKPVKFRMSREQYDFYKNQWHRSIILKARQLGFTTEVCIMQLDAAVFMKKKCAMIAHTLHDAQRLFREKTQFAYDHLPIEVKAANPVRKMTTEELVLKNGGSVTVSTSFRGGTLYSLHISEFGKICAKFPDKAREIVSGAFEAVPADGYITLESTAEGREGKFYELCMEAQKLLQMGKELGQLDWKFFFYSWHMNGGYAVSDEESSREGVFIQTRLREYFDKLKGMGIELTRAQELWYAGKEKTLGADMLREYPSTPEEAFQQTIEGAYYAKQITNLRINGKIGKVFELNPHLPVMTFWDLGVGDSMAIWFIRRVSDKCYQVIDYYENSGEGLRHYFRILKEKGYDYSEHYAPHDIRNREMTSDAKSRLEMAYEGYEIDGEIYSVDFNVVPRVKEKNDAIELVREILPYCEFDEERCDAPLTEGGSSGLAMLEKYRKQWDEKNGRWRDKPLHDWTSNCADAFATFAQAMNMDFGLPEAPDEVGFW